MDYKNFSEGNMKNKIVCIVLFLVIGCLALEIGFARGSDKNSNPSPKKFEEAKNKLSSIVDDARKANLGNSPIVKDAKDYLDIWKNINKNNKNDLDPMIKSINNFTNEIKTLITISRLENKINNLENQKRQEKLYSNENDLLNMLIVIAIWVVVLVIFSMFAGWYIGKQSTLKYLEKAGLW